VRGFLGPLCSAPGAAEAKREPARRGTRAGASPPLCPGNASAPSGKAARAAVASVTNSRLLQNSAALGLRPPVRRRVPTFCTSPCSDADVFTQPLFFFLEATQNQSLPRCSEGSFSGLCTRTSVFLSARRQWVTPDYVKPALKVELQISSSAFCRRSAV